MPFEIHEKIKLIRVRNLNAKKALEFNKVFLNLNSYLLILKAFNVIIITVKANVKDKNAREFTRKAISKSSLIR